MSWMEGWGSRTVAVTAWASALIVFGVWMLFQVPLEWVPEVELPEVRIHAAWPGSSPRAVERYVTAPIERAVQRVPGTASVESISQEGTATVVLGVADNVRLGAYVAQVNEELGRLRDVLPDRVRPRLTKSVPEALRSERGFMTIQLVGPEAPDVLRRLAEEPLPESEFYSRRVVHGGGRHERLRARLSQSSSPTSTAA